jgi:hypothetical protein
MNILCGLKVGKMNVISSSDNMQSKPHCSIYQPALPGCILTDQHCLLAPVHDLFSLNGNSSMYTLSSYRAVNSSLSVTKTSPLKPYRETMAVCSEIHSKRVIQVQCVGT